MISSVAGVLLLTVTKCPNKNILREEKVILTHRLSRQSITVGKAWMAV